MASHASVIFILDIIKHVEWCLLFLHSVIMPKIQSYLHCLYIYCIHLEMWYGLYLEKHPHLCFYFKMSVKLFWNWVTKYLNLNIKNGAQYDLYKFFICNLTSCIFPSGFFSVKRRDRMRFLGIPRAW